MREWLGPTGGMLTVVALVFAVQQVHEATRQSDSAVRGGLVSLRAETAERLKDLSALVEKGANSLEAILEEFQTVDIPPLPFERMTQVERPDPTEKFLTFLMGIPNTNHLFRPDNNEIDCDSFTAKLLGHLSSCSLSEAERFAVRVVHSSTGLDQARESYVQAIRASNNTLKLMTVKLVYASGDTARANYRPFPRSEQIASLRQGFNECRQLLYTARNYRVALEDEMQELSRLISEIDGKLLGNARIRRGDGIK